MLPRQAGVIESTHRLFKAFSALHWAGTVPASRVLVYSVRLLGGVSALYDSTKLGSTMFEKYLRSTWTN